MLVSGVGFFGNGDDEFPKGPWYKVRICAAYLRIPVAHLESTQEQQLFEFCGCVMADMELIHRGSQVRSNFLVRGGTYENITVEHPFGTIKCWMGYTHFQTKTLKRTGSEMLLPGRAITRWPKRALHLLAYNIKRVINIIGIRPLLAAMVAAWPLACFILGA